MSSAAVVTGALGVKILVADERKFLNNKNRYKRLSINVRYFLLSKVFFAVVVACYDVIYQILKCIKL